MLLPRQPVPELKLPTTAGKDFDLDSDTPKHFSMVVFYRGLHCPICHKYLSELARLLPEFEQRGVSITAISSDTLERAREMQVKSHGENITWGFELPLSVAKLWGLYISTSRGKTSIGIEEPALFSEPGVFLVRPDNTLYYGAVQTMPFARPVFKELLGSIDFAIDKDYPARGEYTGPV